MGAVRNAEQGGWEGHEENTSNQEPRSEWVSRRRTLGFSNLLFPFHRSSCNPSPTSPNGTTKAPLTTTTIHSAFSPTPTPSLILLPLPNLSIPAVISKKTVSYYSLTPFILIYAFNQTINYWFDVFTLASVTSFVVIKILEYDYLVFCLVGVDLKSALGKKRRDGKSAPPQPLTAMQRIHIGRLVDKYGDDYQVWYYIVIIQ